MLRATIAGLMLAATGTFIGGVLVSGTASAQWGALFGDDPSPHRPSFKRPPGDGFTGDERHPSRALSSGGARPSVAPIAPDRISFPSDYPVGSIVIDHQGRQLFFIESSSRALRYPISVGREGFGWTGTQQISKVVSWPGWTPPASMRARDPRLPVHMTGGLKNPLGAKALYLGSSLYRIHGTNDPKSIGRAASSGCFRMLNGHVVDLASRVDVGTAVTVVRSLPPSVARLVAQQTGGSLPPQAAIKDPPQAAIKGRPVRRPANAFDDLFGSSPRDELAGEGAGASTRLF
jgi:hypothetical protein